MEKMEQKNYDCKYKKETLNRVSQQLRKVGIIPTFNDPQDWTADWRGGPSNWMTPPRITFQRRGFEYELEASEMLVGTTTDRTGALAPVGGVKLSLTRSGGGYKGFSFVEFFSTKEKRSAAVAALLRSLLKGKI